MNSFLLLALTAGLLSPVPASALFGEKDGKKVWSSHKIINDRKLDIYRTYDSFTEKAWCSHDRYYYSRDLEFDRAGGFQVSNGYRKDDKSSYIFKSHEGIEIKYGNNKPKPFTNLLGFLTFDDFSKYRTVKLRIKERNWQPTYTINTSEVKKFIKSYKACERSTSK